MSAGGRKARICPVPFLCGLVIGDPMGSKAESPELARNTSILQPPLAFLQGWAERQCLRPPHPQAKGTLLRKMAGSIVKPSPKREGAAA